MGFCPNCGSWVEEGDACNFCGGSGSQNDSGGATYSGRSSSSPLRKCSQKDINSCKISLRNALEPKESFIPDACAEYLLKVADGNFSDFIMNLEDTVNDIRRYKKFEFIGIRLEKDKSTIDGYNTVFRFLNQTEYADIVFNYQYDGGRGFFDWDMEISDEKLKRIPQFKALINELKHQGFEYNGIDSIMDKTGYDSQPYHHVILNFERKGFHFKKYKFVFSDFTHEEYSNRLHVHKILEGGYPEEKELLKAEIRRIEKEYQCSYDKSSLTDNYLCFTLSNGRKLICEYDGEKLEKVLECSVKEFETNHKIQYCFEIVPWDPF